MRSKALYAAAAVIITVAGPVVAADPYGYGEVEIEELHGKLYRAADQWLLDVHYDVEIEEIDYIPRLELILTVFEDGHVLVDERGQAIQFVIPLQHPSELEDDEVEFEAGFKGYLPYGSVHRPHHLRIEGAVVLQGDDRPIVVKDKSIKYKGSRRGGGHAIVSLGFGYQKSYPEKRYLPRHRRGSVFGDLRHPGKYFRKHVKKYRGRRFHPRYHRPFVPRHRSRDPYCRPRY